MPELEKALENIGLSDKEIGVLTVLLESGPMYAAAVAKAAKLNRTTAYGILRQLSDKGLASHAKKEGVVRYQSIAPELLPGYIERRSRELLEIKDEVAKLIPQIKLRKSKGHVLPKMQFFEGKEGAKQAYEDVLENNKEKFLRGITGMDAVYKEFGDAWVEYFISKRTRLGIGCTNLVPETEGGKRSKADDHKYMRTTKFLPPKYNFAGDISIYDNKVGLFTYVQENPVAVIIEDENIANMMKKLFDYMESTTK